MTRSAMSLARSRISCPPPGEADVFSFPDGAKVFVARLTTYDARHYPIEHSRYSWPTDAVRAAEDYDDPATT